MRQCDHLPRPSHASSTYACINAAPTSFFEKTINIHSDLSTGTYRYITKYDTSNLGPSSAAWAVYATHTGIHPVATFSTYCGPVNSNNVAEHVAPLLAIADMWRRGARRAVIHTDSCNFRDHLPS